MMRLEEKIRGGIYGLLIGDAVGVPYEFNSPERLPAYELIDMIPPQSFRSSYPHIAYGTWSDDGAQALCVLASLLHCKKLDPTDLLNRFCNWYRAGYLAIDHQVFDIGIQTREALTRYVQGTPINQIANTDVSANGNGALMRVLPLALWHRGSDAELIEDAFAQAHLTHGHIRSKLCCALYCLWARQLLNDVDIDQAWLNSIAILKQTFNNQPEVIQEIEQEIDLESTYQIQGKGYVVDCLLSAKYALKQNSYADVIKTAISLGHDTDTTACVAGGLAGIVFGESAIPEPWKVTLKGQEMVEPLLEALLKLHV